MFDITLKIVLLISPLFYIVDMPMLSAEKLCFFLSVVSLFCASMFAPRLRELKISFKYCIVAIIGSCLYSSCVNGFHPSTVIYAVNVLLCVLIFKMTYCFAGRVQDYDKYIIFAAIINSLICIAQNTWGNFLPFQVGSFGALFGNSPRIGIYLAVVFPIIFYRYWYLAILPLIACFIGYPEKNILIAVFICIICVDARKWLKVGLIGTAMLFMYQYGLLIRIYHSLVTPGRLERYTTSVKSVFINPLKGFGLGNLPEALGGNNINVTNTIYSSHLQILICGGLVVFCIYFFIWKHFFTTLHINRYSMSIISIFLLGLFEYPFEIVKIWPTISVIFALYCITINNKEKNHGNR